MSFDDEAPQIISLHTGLNPDNGNRPWELAVADNIIIKTSEHHLAAAGAHVLKFWRVDPGVVLEKLVISHGNLPASYLGPPEIAPRPLRLPARGTWAAASRTRYEFGARL